MEFRPIFLTERQKHETALRMVSADGFKQEFRDSLHLYDSPRECFEELNNLFIDMTGVARYSSWDSARTAMNK